MKRLNLRANNLSDLTEATLLTAINLYQVNNLVDCDLIDKWAVGNKKQELTNLSVSIRITISFAIAQQLAQPVNLANELKLNETMN